MVKRGSDSGPACTAQADPGHEQHLLGCRSKAAESARCWTWVLQLIRSSLICRITVLCRAQRYPKIFSVTLQLEETFGYSPTLQQWTQLFGVSQWERVGFKQWTLCTIANSWHYKIPKTATDPPSNKFYLQNLLTSKLLIILGTAGCWKGTICKRPRPKAYLYFETKDTHPRIFSRQ